MDVMEGELGTYDGGNALDRGGGEETVDVEDTADELESRLLLRDCRVVRCNLGTSRSL